MIKGILKEFKTDSHYIPLLSNLESLNLQDCEHPTMPPQKKRRNDDEQKLTKSKKPKFNMPRKGYSLETELKQSFSYKKCKSLFQNYSSVEDPNKINPDGMIQFCKDIDIDPENVGMLVLAWHMKAKQMGYFSLEEWSHGLEELQCDSIFKIKSKFEELQESLSNPTVFKNVYRYAFDFCRDKDQRSLDIEMAIPMLRLLLQSRWELFPYFQRYLEESNHRVINKDQWYNILEFCRTIKPDLQNYDEDGAWPVLLDEFVHWYKLSQN